MSIKLAINGFGRIGRLAFRRAYEVGGFEVVAINDLVDAKTLAYLLKYDTTQGSWHVDDIKGVVTKDEQGNVLENYIEFKGVKIPVLGKKDPHDLKWSEYGVDIVLECTGRLKSHEDGDVHLHNGAKGVIISAPSSSKDIPTFVYGVNTDKLTKDMTIISGGSCTTNCLAPVVSAAPKARSSMPPRPLSSIPPKATSTSRSSAGTTTNSRSPASMSALPASTARSSAASNPSLFGGTLRGPFFQLLPTTC